MKPSKHSLLRGMSPPGLASRALRVVVASGKGGTGKTLVSSQLALWFASKGTATTYVDVDAEAPNGHVVLRPELDRAMRVRTIHPVIDLEACTGCGDCAEACAFGALVPGRDRVLPILEHCRGCGACGIACSRGAISESLRQVGSVVCGKARGIGFVAGVVDVGERRAVPVIEAAISVAAEQNESGILVIDGPPGNSCPVMAALKLADVAVLVTEPTPFGAHDLEITADICAKLRVPAAVVLNRAGLAEPSLDSSLTPRSLSVVATIPFDPAIAVANARGSLASSPEASLSAAVGSLGVWVQSWWHAALASPPSLPVRSSDGGPP